MYISYCLSPCSIEGFSPEQQAVLLPCKPGDWKHGTRWRTLEYDSGAPAVDLTANTYLIVKTSTNIIFSFSEIYVHTLPESQIFMEIPLPVLHSEQCIQSNGVPQDPLLSSCLIQVAVLAASHGPVWKLQTWWILQTRSAYYRVNISRNISLTWSCGTFIYCVFTKNRSVVSAVLRHHPKGFTAAR